MPLKTQPDRACYARWRDRSSHWRRNVDTQPYQRLFTHLGIYRLPAGTEALCVWTGRLPRAAGMPRACWILVPCDPPDDRTAWHQHYEVRRDGTIVRTRYLAVPAAAHSDDVPQAAFQTEGITDLTIEDFECVWQPFA